MDERADTLADEVEAFVLLFVIQALELDDPLEEEFVSERELLVGDVALVHDSNCGDELAVVKVVFFWKDAIE